MKKEELLKHVSDGFELKQVIIKNLDMPVVIFCGEDAYRCGFPFNQIEDIRVSTEWLTLYNEECWYNKEELLEQLEDDIFDEMYRQDLESLLKCDPKKELEKRAAEYDFIETIVIFVGY